MIRFENVVKRFGGRTVLDGVSFEISKGETVVLLGASGTGKSVTLKHIVGLLAPDAGRVEATTERIGYLFQAGALLAWMNVYENVALPLFETTKLKAKEIDRKVMEALRAVGLEEDAEKFPSEISGGMQKRAGLARAIVRDAEVILYDEPTSGLDPLTSANIMKLIKGINRDRGVTSVVVTHDIPMALKIADRLILLKDGRVAFAGTPAEFTSSVDGFVREFIAATKGEML